MKSNSVTNWIKEVLNRGEGQPFYKSEFRPDVVSELPSVGTPAEEGGTREEETPHPAGHQQTLGEPPPVELTLENISDCNEMSGS